MKPDTPGTISHDLDSTDTLPLLALDPADTEIQANAALFGGNEPTVTQNRPVLPEPVPAEDLDEEPEPEAEYQLVERRDPGATTDSYAAPYFAPPKPAAIPAGVPDLADSLRASEQRLERLIKWVGELEEELQVAARRYAELQRERDALRQALTRPAPSPAPQPTGFTGRFRRENWTPDVEHARLQRDLVLLRRQNERLLEVMATVQGQLGVREALLGEAEEALRVATAAGGGPAGAGGEDLTARCAALAAELETERASAARANQAHEAALAALRAAMEQMREASSPQASDTTATESDGSSSMRASIPPIGSVLRVLIREEGGSEVVYPLGRYTRIGRTSDNDIQVDTTYVSRHHAVLLAGVDHCIVEDLNSTNGVLVNGERVSRQVLHDGDAVTIGKTQFRYQQRS